MDAPKARRGRAAPLLVLIFALLAVGIAAAGVIYYRIYAAHYRIQVEQQLTSIADLKTGEVLRWRKERLADARIFWRNAAFADLVQRYLQAPGDREAQEPLGNWLGWLWFNHEYDRLLLLDSQGEVRFSIPEAADPVPTAVKACLDETAASADATLTDFYRDERSGRVRLAVVAPVFDRARGNRTQGTVVLQIDPEQYLYPFIRRWPTPSATAETLLVRREGGEVLFLNALRFRGDAALALRVPLESQHNPVVRAVLGEKGIVEGRDYRGEPVVASLRAIPDSPWFLVARMDTSEVYATMRERRWVMIVFVAVLLLGAGAGLATVWHRQTARADRERGEAEEFLKESEERFRLASQAVADVIWEWELASGHLEWYGRIDELLGYGPAEFPRTLAAWEKAIHPDDHGRVMAALDRHLSTGEPYDQEYRVLTQDGRLRYWQDRGVSIRDPHGRAVRMIGACTDITSRKEAEEEVRTRESQQRALLDSIQDIAWLKDRESRFVAVNGPYGRACGLPPAEVVGKTDRDIWPAELAEIYLAGDREVMASRRNVRVEEPVADREGRIAMIETIKTPVYDDRGEVIGTAGIARDVTERKRSDERIAHLNRVLHAIRDVNQLIARARDPLDLTRRACEILVEARGFSGAMILLTGEAGAVSTVAGAGFGGVFPRFAEGFRASGPPPCCQAARECRGVYLVSDLVRPCAPCPLSGFCPTNETLCIRLRCGEENHGYFTVSTPLGVGSDQEEQSLFADLAADIALALHNLEVARQARQAAAERDRAEMYLRQAQKMDAIGRLAGGLAHDFNNMLSIILGFTEMALRRVSSSEPVCGDLNEIRKAAQRSADLTRQLLAFSRQQVISPRPLDANNQLWSIGKMLSRLIAEEIELRVVPGKDLWAIRMDPSQFEQIVVNLVTNARDAIEGRGRIVVETANVTLGPAACTGHPDLVPGDYVLLAVSDTGVGMDEGILGKIFEPFFTTKEIGRGTGLGLATVHGIVKQNRGFIEVISEPGGGSAFRVYLPRLRPEVPATVVPDVRESPAAPLSGR